MPEKVEVVKAVASEWNAGNITFGTLYTIGTIVCGVSACSLKDFDIIGVSVAHAARRS